MERSEDIALVSWSAPQCPFDIQYSARVLDDICLAVVDAFFLAPHGGVEIGGILLGDFEEERLRITGYAPVECEHAFGPSFMLSDHDRERLAEMLGPRTVLPGHRAVGWYHSHTRSEVLFSDADREIHQRFFPEAWQAALVLRPHTFQPTRAGFFFREADGSIHGEASYKEFVLQPLPPRPEELDETPAGVAEPAPAPRRASVRPVAPNAAPPIPPDPGPEPAPEEQWWSKARLAMVACLSASGAVDDAADLSGAALLAYGAFEISRLQRDLKAQTERADQAEKSLADARNQLRMQREKGSASADADR
jgi:proteasome lid subunit RPN8/RPN11